VPFETNGAFLISAIIDEVLCSESPLNTLFIIRKWRNMVYTMLHLFLLDVAIIVYLLLMVLPQNVQGVVGITIEGVM
jgi:hypothetical protein